MVNVVFVNLINSLKMVNQEGSRDGCVEFVARMARITWRAKNIQ